MRSVADSKWGEPFAVPVTEAVAPGYRDWVRHPMDLGTVIERLQRSHYASCGEQS